MAELRTLPHRKEAEAAVLGGILLRGRDALGEALELVGEDDFYVPAFQATFRAMCRVEERGEPIDVITLEAQLRRTGEFELVGGIEGLARLDRYATAHNIKAHAELVREAAHLRSLAVAGRELAERAMSPDADATEVQGLAEVSVLSLSRPSSKAGPRAAKALMVDVFGAITERQRNGDQLTGVPTGFDQLDEMTAGLQPGDLIIIAARPSMGKTAFALNIAAHASVCQPKHWQLPADQRPPLLPTLVFSLEMSATQLVERVLCSEARVDSALVRRGGRMLQQDFRALIAAAERIADSPLYIDDSAALTITDIKGRARRWRADPKVFPDPDPSDPTANHRGLGLILVDYIQLAKGSRKHDSREQEISEISRELKALGKELGLPVVALSQLNRAVDTRSDHRPQLSDLRESGAIEQDADVIAFIYREERYLTPDAPEEKRSEVEGKAEIIVGKQRNGDTGTVTLHFSRHLTRFENLERQW